MSKEKRKRAIAPGIIAAAFVSALIIFALMIYTEKAVLASEEKQVCLFVKEELQKGTRIDGDKIETFFEMREVPSSIVPEGSILKAEEIINQIATSDIAAGSMVTKYMFYDADEVLLSMTEPVLLGFKAEDLYQVIGGTLRKGDQVHIYSCDEEGNVNLRWSNIYIQSAFDSAGDELEGDESGKALRFNIYLEKEDVEEFYALLDSKQLRAVKVCQ